MAKMAGSVVGFARSVITKGYEKMAVIWRKNSRLADQRF